MPSVRPDDDMICRAFYLERRSRSAIDAQADGRSGRDFEFLGPGLEPDEEPAGTRIGKRPVPRVVRHDRNLSVGVSLRNGIAAVR